MRSSRKQELQDRRFFNEKNSSIPKAFGMPRDSIYSPLKFRGDVIRQLPDERGVNNENLIFSFWAEIKLV